MGDSISVANSCDMRTSLTQRFQSSPALWTSEIQEQMRVMRLRAPLSDEFMYPPNAVWGKNTCAQVQLSCMDIEGE